MYQRQCQPGYKPSREYKWLLNAWFSYRQYLMTK